MYEVELKVEINEQEKAKLQKKLLSCGFVFQGAVPQDDHYIETTSSPYGNFNFKRYRQEGTTYVYTEKIWELVNGSSALRENEHEVSKKIFESEIAKFPDRVEIHKQRELYTGTQFGCDLHVSIDSVKFDHSTSMRYFIEVEIITSDKNNVSELRKKIIAFLGQLLGEKDGFMEAPGMLVMAVEKK